MINDLEWKSLLSALQQFKVALEDINKVQNCEEVTRKVKTLLDDANKNINWVIENYPANQYMEDNPFRNY